MTGTPQLKQGTRGNTTRGQKITGGPPTLREGEGRGHSTRERGGRGDTRQDTDPRRGKALHRKDLSFSTLTAEEGRLAQNMFI